MANNGPWHAFYSATSIKLSKQYCYIKDEEKQKKYKNVHTNFYINKNTGKTIEISAVYRTKIYPNYNNCPYYFKDKVYLGIVDEWVSIGQYDYI